MSLALPLPNGKLTSKKPAIEIQIGTEIFILRKGAFLHEVFQQIMKISTILLSVQLLTRAPLSFS
jgi:hypothetical protein